MATRPNQNLSTRLYLQAALTALFAPVNPGGKGFMLVAFLLAAGAAGLGAWVRTNPPQARNATIGFEAVAVLVGVVGLMHHSYVPGTIIGIATLIAVLNSSPVATSAPVSATQPATQPAQPVLPAQAAPPFAAQPAYAAQPFASAAPGFATGFAAAPVAPAAPVPVRPPVPAGQWAADPTGRHHYRWWDGQTWTPHVSNNGVTAVDPL